MENITENIHTRHTFTQKERLDLADTMAGAESAINRKAEELKSVTTQIKADIATQEGILHSSAEKLRAGYEMRTKEVNVLYDKGMVKYTDKDTGEVLEERPMTEEEQLRLTEHRTDAEVIIRRAREQEN